MLYFITAWGLLLVISSAVGLGLLQALRATAFRRQGDRLVASLWLGTLAIAIAWLATALWLPLSPGVGGLVAGGLSLWAGRSPATRQELRQELRQWYGQFRSVQGGVVLGLAIALASFMSRQVTWLDTGLYHYGAIRWLADFGVVPGVALLYSQLGFMSSWLALAAPLNPAVLGPHVTAVTNGFILLVAAIHLLVSLSQLRLSPSSLPNGFALAFLALVLPTLIGLRLMREILVSPSPDIPSLLLVGIVSWSLLLVQEAALENSPPDPYRAVDGDPQPSGDLSPAVVLFLAAGAFTIKLTALPLLLVAGCFYLLQSGFRRERLWVGCSVLILLLLPLIASSIVASGCPLFPSTALCLDLPWSPRLTEPQSTLQGALNWTHWFPPPPPGQLAWLWYFQQWFQNSRSNQLLAGGLVAALLLVKSVLSSRNLPQQGQAWLLAISGLGMGFLILTSLLLRFALGYLVVVPALAIALWLQPGQQRSAIAVPTPPARTGLFTKLFPRIVAGCSMGFILAVSLKTTPSALPLNPATPLPVLSRLWLPPALPAEEVVQKQVNSITYFTPKRAGALCWSAPLPCAFEVTAQIDLRHPAQGIAAGFIRKPDSSQAPASSGIADFKHEL